MSSDNLYRNNAEDCLRMAQAAVNDGDRPFWYPRAIMAAARRACDARRRNGDAKASGRLQHALIRALAPPHRGKLSCFLPGISTRLPRSMASALAIRGRVARGMITSSI